MMPSMRMGRACSSISSSFPRSTGWARRRSSTWQAGDAGRHDQRAAGAAQAGAGPLPRAGPRPVGPSTSMVSTTAGPFQLGKPRVRDGDSEAVPASAAVADASSRRDASPGCSSRIRRRASRGRRETRRQRERPEAEFLASSLRPSGWQLDPAAAAIRLAMGRGTARIADDFTLPCIVFYCLSLWTSLPAETTQVTSLK